MPAPTTTIRILASPFAGMTQSRFGGCDLSPLWEGTPVWPRASQAAIGCQVNGGQPALCVMRTLAACRTEFTS